MTTDRGTMRPSTPEDRRIVDAARAIRAVLRDLAGPGADEIDRALGALLDRADRGENVAAEIVALLDREPATQAWLADHLRGATASPAEAAPAPTSEVAPPAAPPPTGSRRRLDFDRFRARVPEEPSATRRASPRAAGATAKTYAYVDCPDVVVAAVEFDLVVGLSDKPTPGVASDGPLPVPDRDYALSIDVHAEGFTLRHGETWRQAVQVTAENRRPRLRFHLTAKAPSKPFQPRTIKASYCVDGQIVGMATRFLVVTRAPEDVAKAPAPPPTPGVDIAVPAARTAPDLTARILIGDDNPGEVFWNLNSPWDVRIPADQYSMEVGDARAFLRSLVSDVSRTTGQPAVYEELLGVGRRIAGLVPAEFWSALTAVDALVEGPPTVLFLSEEPYIPWELAILDAPLDDALPPFLGAQVTVARWILGKVTPSQPPPRERAVGSLAVVVGDYSDSGWESLPEATKEAEALTSDYQAVPIEAQSCAWCSTCSAETRRSTWSISRSTVNTRAMEGPMG